eukprot:scaffold3507_cov62-Attheya_sp.AAC.2
MDAVSDKCHDDEDGFPEHLPYALCVSLRQSLDGTAQYFWLTQATGSRKMDVRARKRAMKRIIVIYVKE